MNTDFNRKFDRNLDLYFYTYCNGGVSEGVLIWMFILIFRILILLAMLRRNLIMMLVAVFDMDCNRDLNKKTTFGFDSDFGFNRDLNMDFDRDANSHFNNDFTIDVNNGLNNDFNFDFYEEFDRDILTLILMEGG